MREQGPSGDGPLAAVRVTVVADKLLTVTALWSASNNWYAALLIRFTCRACKRYHLVRTVVPSLSFLSVADFIPQSGVDVGVRWTPHPLDLTEPVSEYVEDLRKARSPRRSAIADVLLTKY
jgi:hypothetical protein